MINKVIYLSEMYESDGIQYQEWLSSDGQVTIAIGKVPEGVAVVVFNKVDGTWQKVGNSVVRELDLPEEEAYSKALVLGKQIAGREDFEMKEQEDTTSADVAATTGRIPASPEEDWWRKQPKGNVHAPALPK